MVVNAEFAATRLGRPLSTVERGTVSERSCAYMRRWSWPCGCSGELIGGALIELNCCEQHDRERR